MIESEKTKKMIIKRIKAYPKLSYKEFMVVSFKTEKSSVVLYWAGLFEGGNQEEAFIRGENSIEKAELPIYAWGKNYYWQIKKSEDEIKPLEIYEAQILVKLE